MIVRRDEARHHDHAPGIDHIGACLQVGPDFQDPLSFDQNVGTFEITDGRVQRQHDAALDQNAAFGRAAVFRRLRALCGERGAARQASCEAAGQNPGGARFQEAAARTHARIQPRRVLLRPRANSSAHFLRRDNLSSGREPTGTTGVG